MKISSFRAKAHLVFHRCLYNEVSSPTKTVLIDHGTAAQKKFTRQKVVALALHLGTLARTCLVPRPHYCARPMRFGSRGPSEFFVSGTSRKCIDREGPERRRIGTRQSNDYDDGNENGKTAMGHFQSLCFKARLTAKPLT